MSIQDVLIFSSVEYNPDASIDNGSCNVLVVEGCTDQDYIEFSDTANNYNGSCITLIELGCTDPLSINFDEFANVDDGSCLVFGCIDPFALNLDTLANIDDGSCIYEVPLDTTSNSDQECEFPSPNFINTGANMTVMLTPNVTSSFPDNLDEDAYLVAIASNSGIVVGSVDAFGVDQTALAVWGDDSVTPEIDGAAGEVINFQLINGIDLYDIEFTQWAAGDGSLYVTNGVNISSALSEI